jgi:methionine-rich copper-binding protein CopC
MTQFTCIRRAWRAVAILAMVASSLIQSDSALAHSRYTRSEPADGTTVTPGAFVLRAWFTQELMLKSNLTVIDANGAQVDPGDGKVDQDDADRKTMTVSIPELPEGSYTVRWYALSAEDGHDADGTFTFTIGPAAGEPAAEPTAYMPTCRGNDS